MPAALTRPIDGPEYVDLAGLDGLEAESIGLFVFADVRPLKGVAGLIDWRLCGALSRCLLERAFLGQTDETLLMPVQGRFGPRRLFVVGLGEVAACDDVRLGQACARVTQVMAQAGASPCVLAAPTGFAPDPFAKRFLHTVHAAMPTQSGATIARILFERV